MRAFLLQLKQPFCGVGAHLPQTRQQARGRRVTIPQTELSFCGARMSLLPVPLLLAKSALTDERRIHATRSVGATHHHGQEGGNGGAPAFHQEQARLGIIHSLLQMTLYGSKMSNNRRTARVVQIEGLFSLKYTPLWRLRLSQPP